MTSLATLLTNSLSLSEKNTLAQLDQATQSLDVGKHEGVVFTIEGKVVFQCKLSPSFFFFTLSYQGIVGNTKYVDVLCKGLCADTVFEALLMQRIEECIRKDETLAVVGFLEILPDGAKSPGLHLRQFYATGGRTDADMVQFAPVLSMVEREPALNPSTPAGKRTGVTAASTPAYAGSQKETTQKKSHWKNVRNDRRAGKFVQFLVDEFGYTNMVGRENNPVGVLDVAGGKGEVSFELGARRGIPSIVIDPRPVQVTKPQCRVLDFRKRCRVLLKEGLCFSPWARFLYKVRYPVREMKQLQMLFYETFGTEDQGEIDMLKDCTMLVGMHPDGATDAIIKVATREQKPWAVVPCCVFPTQFPHRRLPGKPNSPVKSYEDYCEYIRNGIAPSGCVQETVLGFEGRNRCFYYHPPGKTTS